MIDPTSDRPVYRQVADVLRRRIRDGQVPAGGRLPSESELMAEFGVSRTTARLTYGVLRGEGLVESRRGHGAFVRRPRTVQRVAADRYRRPATAPDEGEGAMGATSPGGPGDGPPVPGDGQAGTVASGAGATARPAGGDAGSGSAAGPATPFTADHDIAWEDYRLDHTFTEVPAPAEVAELFGVEPESPLLARRFVFFSRGEPRQASTSYVPLELVAGTPVADPANEPWPGGTIAQLESLGVTVTRVEESVGARMPTPEERRTLRVAEGVPVLTVTRRMLAGHRVVEVAADIVLPADRFVLDYAIDLPGPADP